MINNKYQLMIILNHCNYVKSLLFLKEKNLLISSGKDGTKFWNINNMNFICDFEKLDVVIGMH